MKRWLSLILAAALAVCVFAACSKDDNTSGSAGKHHVEIEVQDYGTIAVELDGDAAPITVDNFLKLAKEGFYDGLTFHRIIDGFMIQGGDPEGTGMGGSDETIKGEFSANGVENNLSHTRGAISMARNSVSMDSASSQFFIVQSDSTFLDGQYACFGYVTSGMDIVDQHLQGRAADGRQRHDPRSGAAGHHGRPRDRLMGKQLVLAEKPSVGRELARVLGCRRGGEGYLEGDRYVVTWALGHLVTLADPDVYEKKWEKWDMADLPMLPQHRKLVVIPQTARQFRVVQGLMKRGDITGLIIATDAGREGELVARWIMAKAGWNKPAKRLWISSQTDKAIRDGFADLRPAADYENLFRSAQARSEADWLVGLNVTRALTCKYNAQLSAGRVQTPTLALIAAREQEIRSFVPKEFYGVRLKLAGFTAVWRDANGNSRTFDRALAERIAEACRTGTCTIRQVRRMRRMTPPPAAYDLTELQRDANKKYAYSAKETLNLMQALYEQHKLLTVSAHGLALYLRRRRSDAARPPACRDDRGL